MTLVANRNKTEPDVLIVRNVDESALLLEDAVE